MTSIRILWIGGGSLGLMFAARCALAQEGTNALLVRNEQQYHILNGQGLELIGDDGRFTAFLPCFQNVPPADSRDSWDWIALMVKQTHLADERTAVQLETLASLYPHANWVCFQNGTGHIERLSSIIPRERLHIAVTTEAARKLDDRTVHHTGRGMTFIGSPEAAPGPEYQEKMLIQALGKAGFDARVSNNIKETVWKKLLINAVINPLTAILRIRNGELLESRERIDWMRELFQEGLAVARAEGVNLSPGLWEELLSVCRRTANNHSSMLQDIMNGRRTEMEWINGSLLKAGARHGLELPAHAAVVRRIREMERDNRG